MEEEDKKAERGNFKELPKERSSRYKENIYNNFYISCIGLLS